MKEKLSSILKGERLILKENKPDVDLAKTIFNLVDKNREYLSLWLPWVDETRSYEDNLNFAKSIFDSKDKVVYGIYLKNELIGIIGVNEYNEKENSCELGYWISEEAAGHGYMTEALKILEKELFEKGNLNKIELSCDERNIGSKKVLEKNNYTLEKRFEEEAYYNHEIKTRETLLYSKTKEKYENKFD